MGYSQFVYKVRSQLLKFHSILTVETCEGKDWLFLTNLHEVIPQTSGIYISFVVRNRSIG